MLEWVAGDALLRRTRCGFDSRRANILSSFRARVNSYTYIFELKNPLEHTSFRTKKNLKCEKYDILNIPSTNIYILPMCL